MSSFEPETRGLTKPAARGELKKDQVYRRIMELIGSGSLADGKFPSEPEFCKMLDVSRVTLRAALKRLEKEGIITRSHYYGTRLAQNKTPQRILITWTPANFPHSGRKTCEVRYIEEECRKRRILYDFLELYFLQDPEKLAEKYSAIILFGAAINGNEPFMEVIRQSRLPVIYCREDDRNIITDTIASVGVDMKKAYIAGIDYLLQLGCRRIMVLVKNDERFRQRLGFSRQELAEILKAKNAEEPEKMICRILEESSVDELTENIRQLKPEAIYCYSDYDALGIYKILHSLGRKIPQDVAVMGFGCGSDLVTPTLSSVSLVSPLFGSAVLEVLEKLTANPNMKAPHLDLPFSIFCGESTAKINVNNLLAES